MKKTWKKLTALAVAMMMVLAMSVTAFAADTDPATDPAVSPSVTATPTPVPTSQTIDADNAVNAQGKYTISVADTDTHTYEVYQILTGTLVAGEKKLGNPAWGADAAATTTYATVADFLTAITASGLSNQDINAIAESVKSATASAETVSKGAPLDVDPGYYLIVDATAALADGDAKSLNIVAVFNDITITPKKGTVESEKHVDDVNDSDSTDHSELKDSADYDIGDSIKYTLTMKLPADYANYKQYYIAFLDDMSIGLTYNNDAKIFYGETDTTGETIAFAVDSSLTSAYAGGKVYKAVIENLKADTATNEQKALAAGDVIKIEYTATLNKDAVIGYEGNPNQYRIDFSSNPNQEADGTPVETNDTPWDTNIVFTYETVFNKVDTDKNPLTGANFTLYKFVESATGTDTYGEGATAKKGTWTDVTTLHTGDDKPKKIVEDYTKGEGAEAKTAKDAKFTFKGIDAGVYKLVESTTPTGYNQIPDQIFTISATHELTADNPKPTDLSGTDGAQFTMTPVKTTGTPAEFTGELDADIENKQGSELPSTGGIGTTIFYVLGAILVLGGTVVLVTRRRMAA